MRAAVGDVTLVDDRGRAVRDLGVIESDVDFVRSRLAPRPVEGQLKTPDDLVRDLEWGKHLAAQAAVLVKQADETRLAVARAYNRALASKLSEATAKSADERRLWAEVELEPLLAQLQQAEVILEYAKRTGKSVEASLSATQTQAKLIESLYRSAGSGS